MARTKPSPSERKPGTWNLGGLSPGQLGKRVLYGIRRDDLFSLASDLAFNAILALFPLLIFLLTLLGIFASHSAALRVTLLQYLARVLPPGAFELVRETLVEVAQTAGTGKLTFGIVLAVWFASGGMSSMMAGVNRAYEVKDSRSWFKARAVAIGLTVAISFFILLALVAVLAGGYLAHIFISHFGLGSLIAILGRIGQNALALACVLLSFSLVYYFGANIKGQRWRWITPGSVVGVLLWLGASFGFRIYLHFFNSYDRTYGSLGVVMILLVWLYITALAFLVGGEVNARIETALSEEQEQRNARIPA